MYKQEVHFKERSWQITGAPITGAASGSTLSGQWQYTITATGADFSGTFHLLPNKSVARRLKMKRVDARKVPAAPSIEQYVLDLPASSRDSERMRRSFVINNTRGTSVEVLVCAVVE